MLRPNIKLPLVEAKQLLAIDPAAAVAAAGRAMAASPTAEARFVLAAALRRTGDLEAALGQIAPLVDRFPKAWGIRYELGMALAGSGRIAEALPALEAAALLNPVSSLVLHALGDTLALVGRAADAAEIQGRAVAGSLGDPRLTAAAAAWLDDGNAAPLAGLGLHLTDVAAVCLVADAGLRVGAADAVVIMLARALSVTPGYLPARFARALALFRLDRSDDALAAVNTVLAAAPVANVRALRAAIQMARGEVDAAIDDYAAAAGTDPMIWHSYGHALRAAGRQDEAVAAYRRALALRPEFAEVYWSLANLKTGHFAQADRAAMATLLTDADADDRASLHFALGKADEDAHDAAASFAHYVAGNAARCATHRYYRAAHEDFVARTIATFTPAFLAERADCGDLAPDAIFVVGMPRSGSTLVEQILASHAEVDGLSELADMPAVARDTGTPYPNALAGLPPADFARAGRDYLDRTRPRRSADRLRFVDKFPGNFLHAGLIHLALPNAAIIDVRRDAVATCFSLFKQLFARGQAYSYDLADLGHYYRHYVALIDHFAAVLPERILTVSYEVLVDDTEATIRRLLDHVELAFDPACLTFHSNPRPVRTASSEQVRQPIFRSGLDGWRAYEDWLGPLLEALGPTLAPAAMPILDGRIR